MDTNGDEQKARAIKEATILLPRKRTRMEVEELEALSEQMSTYAMSAIEVPSYITKTQLVCTSRLKAVMGTFDKKSREYREAAKVLSATKNRKSAWAELGEGVQGEEVGELEVRYYEQKIGPQRRYADPYVELFSLDKQSGLRAAAAFGLYIDFDLEGAYQVILQSLCKQHKIECPELDEHLANRDDQLKEMGGLVVSGNDYTRRKAAKEYFNAVYNGAGDRFELQWARDYGVSTSKQFPACARRFKREMQEVSPALIAKYPEIEAQVNELYPQKRDSSTMFYILSKEERKAIDAMEEKLESMGVRMDSYQGDGGFCRTEDIIRADSFKYQTELEEKLTEAVRLATGMRHTVKIKEIELPRMPVAPTLEFKLDTIKDTGNPEDFQAYIETINRHFVWIRELKDTVLQLRYNVHGDIVNITYTDRGSVMKTFAGVRVVEKIKQTKDGDEAVFCNLFAEGGYFWRTERRQARRIVFEPRPGVEIEPEDFNLFQGLPLDRAFKEREAEFRVAIAGGMLSEGAYFLLGLIKEVLADSDQERYESICRWLNRMLATRTKTDHLPMFIGEQGSYKSVFFGDKGLAKQWYGDYYLKFNNIDQLTQNFNAQMAGILFVCLEEAKPFRKSNTNSDILKDLVDSATVPITPKGKDTFTIDAHFNMQGNTQNVDAIKVEDGCRRYSLHATNNKWSQKSQQKGLITEQEKNDHDNKVWGFVHDKEVVLELFAYFMLYHELVEPGDWVKYRLKPVKTQLRDDQMEHNKCPIERWLSEWRNGEIDMFLPQMGGGSVADRPELQQTETVLAKWGDSYKSGEMFAIWKAYKGVFMSEVREYNDNVSFGIALSKFAKRGEKLAEKTELLKKTGNPPKYYGLARGQ